MVIIDKLKQDGTIQIRLSSCAGPRDIRNRAFVEINGVVLDIDTTRNACKEELRGICFVCINSDSGEILRCESFECVDTEENLTLAAQFYSNRPQHFIKRTFQQAKATFKKKHALILTQIIAVGDCIHTLGDSKNTQNLLAQKKMRLKNLQDMLMSEKNGEPAEKKLKLSQQIHFLDGQLALLKSQQDNIALSITSLLEINFLAENYVMRNYSFGRPASAAEQFVAAVLLEKYHGNDATHFQGLIQAVLRHVTIKNPNNISQDDIKHIVDAANKEFLSDDCVLHVTLHLENDTIESSDVSPLAKKIIIYAHNDTYFQLTPATHYYSSNVHAADLLSAFLLKASLLKKFCEHQLNQNCAPDMKLASPKVLLLAQKKILATLDAVQTFSDFCQHDTLFFPGDNDPEMIVVRKVLLRMIAFENEKIVTPEQFLTFKNSFKITVGDLVYQEAIARKGEIDRQSESDLIKNVKKQMDAVTEVIQQLKQNLNSKNEKIESDITALEDNIKKAKQLKYQYQLLFDDLTQKILAYEATYTAAVEALAHSKTVSDSAPAKIESSKKELQDLQVVIAALRKKQLSLQKKTRNGCK